MAEKNSELATLQNRLNPTQFSPKSEKQHQVRTLRITPTWNLAEIFFNVFSSIFPYLHSFVSWQLCFHYTSSAFFSSLPTTSTLVQAYMSKPRPMRPLTLELAGHAMQWQLTMLPLPPRPRRCCRMARAIPLSHHHPLQTVPPLPRALPTPRSPSPPRLAGPPLRPSISTRKWLMKRSFANHQSKL